MLTSDALAFVAMLHSPATPDLTTFVRPIELHMRPLQFRAGTGDARVKQMLEQDIPQLQRRVAEEHDALCRLGDRENVR